MSRPLLSEEGYHQAPTPMGQHWGESERVVSTGQGMNKGMACWARLGQLRVSGGRSAIPDPTPSPQLYLLCLRTGESAGTPPRWLPGAWVMEARTQGRSSSLAAVQSRVVGPWSLWGQAACQASAETAYSSPACPLPRGVGSKHASLVLAPTSPGSPKTRGAWSPKFGFYLVNKQVPPSSLWAELAEAPGH